MHAHPRHPDHVQHDGAACRSARRRWPREPAASPEAPSGRGSRTSSCRPRRRASGPRAAASSPRRGASCCRRPCPWGRWWPRSCAPRSARCPCSSCASSTAPRRRAAARRRPAPPGPDGRRRPRPPPRRARRRSGRPSTRRTRARAGCSAPAVVQGLLHVCHRRSRPLGSFGRVKLGSSRRCRRSVGAGSRPPPGREPGPSAECTVHARAPPIGSIHHGDDGFPLPAISLCRPAARYDALRPSGTPAEGRALVAQRIEHLTTDQKVGGSNPSERAERDASRHRRQVSRGIVGFFSTSVLGPAVLQDGVAGGAVAAAPPGQLAHGQPFIHFWMSQAFRPNRSAIRPGPHHLTGWSGPRRLLLRSAVRLADEGSALARGLQVCE